MVGIPKSKTKLYGRWASMKERCNNPNFHEYHRYGGRGIKVCPEWEKSFDAFKKWAFENGYDDSAPKGHFTIDRIDNDKGYSPDNCRFIPMSKQASNREKNIIVEVDGERYSLCEWCKKNDVSYFLAKRIYRCQDDIDALMDLRKSGKGCNKYPPIVENVRRYCEENKLSMSKFEKMCGVGNGVIARWEAMYSPSTRTIYKIAAATGIPAAEWVRKHD